MKPEAQEWLRISDLDLRGARTLLDGYVEGAMYFCQQSIEKLLKAILTEDGTEFPKTHDLVELADLTATAFDVQQRTFLTRLADHAVRSRYPGAHYTDSETRLVLEQSEELHKWLRAQLN